MRTGAVDKKGAVMPSLAKTVDDLTPKWFSEVLGCQVNDVQTVPIGTGQSSALVRADVYCADGDQQSFAVKLASSDEVAKQAGHGLGLYLTEVQFYREIAATVDINVPRTYFADIDAGSGLFTLVMDYNENAEQGDNLAAGTVEHAAAALQQIVGLQAPRWNDERLMAVECLRPTNWWVLAETFPTSWEPFVARFGEELTAEEVSLCEVVIPRAFDWIKSWSGPLVLQHGDFRPDNVLFERDANGAPILTVVDWQTARLGPPLIDVAFYVGGSLATYDRRAHEEALVRGYHERLTSSGVSGYSWQDCWDDYRCASLYGLIAFVGVIRHIRSTQRGDELFLEGFRRYAAAAQDLDAVRYLP